MDERLHRLDQRHNSEVHRVHGDLVRQDAIRVAETFGREVPVGALFTLQREQARRQLAGKQDLVEMIVGLLQFRVGLVGGVHRLSTIIVYCAIQLQFCIVRFCGENREGLHMQRKRTTLAT